VSVRSEVLLWAQRVVSKKGAAPHVLLEIKVDAGVDEAQAAFHRIARQAHPDLHRNSLTPEELETVTTAYSRVAAAYQDFRTQRMQSARMRAIKDADAGVTVTRPIQVKPITDPPPVTGGPGAGAAAGAGQMSSKALIYYRKAELCLRRGDLRGSVLQLKMAIATDPQSSFLRTALAEVEVEVGKKP
jgi:hypothetical protein